MQINSTMDLVELNARTQNALTEAQTRTLRDLLADTDYENTEDVPEGEWLKMLEEADRS
ncbi:hypothetical protein DEIPH_ctg007orf0001 [Deinococcus phoenicis]|uniref:Uncharacterized protein n=1 Tax=Deinococcus phoenicis TaxID=1476583 RepID=A0A016QTW1_9DEIO|nr:hypothetical protein [Deinococcus phoenicis]EYB69436.1 hypothetical protein DEIPH_ctg007orf0001 [Deinococcus phoenicis]